jgi:hypothetical protein
MSESESEQDTITITIGVETTDNPRVVLVDGVTTVGRAEARRAMLAKARDLVDEALASLFPAA